MSLTSTGLSNLQGLGVGQTTNFIVQYENTLANQANVIANANALLQVLETEFTVTTGSGWFNTPTPPTSRCSWRLASRTFTIGAINKEGSPPASPSCRLRSNEARIERTWAG